MGQAGRVTAPEVYVAGGEGDPRSARPTTEELRRIYGLEPGVAELCVRDLGLAEAIGGRPVLSVRFRPADGVPTAGRRVGLGLEGGPLEHPGGRGASGPWHTLREWALAGACGGGPHDPLFAAMRLASLLPSPLLVDLALRDPRNPLRLLAGGLPLPAELGPGHLLRFAAERVERQMSSAGTPAAADYHSWVALGAEGLSRRDSPPTVHSEPRAPLAGWEGCAGWDHVSLRGAARAPFFTRLPGHEPGEPRESAAAPSPAAAAAAGILASLLPEVSTELHLAHGGDALRQARGLGAAGAEELLGFLEGGALGEAQYVSVHNGAQFYRHAVGSLAAWEAALRRFAAQREGGRCHSRLPGRSGAHGGHWSETAVAALYTKATAWAGPGADLASWGAALRRRIERSPHGSPTADDVAAWARSAAARGADPRIESIGAVRGDRVRVVLREPIFARVIVQGGRAYRERVPGSAMRQHPMAAFDLIFVPGQSGFPFAVAWADRGCTVAARHANIQGAAAGSPGRICMGDLAQGGEDHATARFSDFLGMMALWNLDSAFNSGEDYLMQRVTPRPPGAHAGTWWTTYAEGLERIDVGYQALQDPDADGADEMGSFEPVEE